MLSLINRSQTIKLNLKFSEDGEHKLLALIQMSQSSNHTKIKFKPSSVLSIPQNSFQFLIPLKSLMEPTTRLFMMSPQILVTLNISLLSSTFLLQKIPTRFIQFSLPPYQMVKDKSLLDLTPPLQLTMLIATVVWSELCPAGKSLMTMTPIWKKCLSDTKLLSRNSTEAKTTELNSCQSNTRVKLSMEPSIPSNIKLPSELFKLLSITQFFRKRLMAKSLTCLNQPRSLNSLMKMETLKELTS